MVSISFSKAHARNGNKKQNQIYRVVKTVDISISTDRSLLNKVMKKISIRRNLVEWVLIPFIRGKDFAICEEFQATKNERIALSISKSDFSHADVSSFIGTTQSCKNNAVFTLPVMNLLKEGD